jgi:hypothetical protein
MQQHPDQVLSQRFQQYRPISERRAKPVTYEQTPESPIHRIREEFRRSARDAATASDGLKLADDIVAALTTIDREDARRLIKLVRDLLDTLESKIERPD